MLFALGVELGLTIRLGGVLVEIRACERSMRRPVRQRLPTRTDLVAGQIGGELLLRFLTVARGVVVGRSVGVVVGRSVGSRFFLGSLARLFLLGLTLSRGRCLLCRLAALLRGLTFLLGGYVITPFSVWTWSVGAAAVVLFGHRRVRLVRQRRLQRGALLRNGRLLRRAVLSRVAALKRTVLRRAVLDLLVGLDGSRVVLLHVSPWWELRLAFDRSEEDRSVALLEAILDHPHRLAEREIDGFVAVVVKTGPHGVHTGERIDRIFRVRLGSG